MATTPQGKSQFGTSGQGSSSQGGSGTSTFPGGSNIGGSNIGAPSRQGAREHTEGPVARQIEQQTAKLPSDIFLWSAFAAMGVGIILQATGSRERGNFVAQWAPTLLILGLYNKVVKVAGHDAVTGHSPQSL